ncbi:unnamed protein product [Kluyveromyces dobzhanskii CBS 2104]|uniref:WGS project CCBQ000000000 data, contig 00015 n=1 Tax=Kluyveromyces dobzhanskii CBS 2104 TaxID=1427455 RepID=A0A0A8LAW7_9SACH|nr:unnamed protein product [Kluyveromyces dobzhanskii CBS 2104]
MNDDNNGNSILSTFEIPDGPYAVSPLIENVPKEYEYSCIEYYEQHIYLATTSGILLHYYELDPGNFTLISEVNFNEDRSMKIDSITLLPKVDRALVLSEGRIKMFLLPEFAPASNVPSIMNIRALSVLRYVETSKCYSCYLYTPNLVKQVSITSKEIKVERKFNIKGIKTASPSRDIKNIIAAVKNSYAVINLEKESTTPLFQVSEAADVELSPIVTKFGKNDFIVTCGISNDESCMGLILNGDGEITHGTVVIESYPSAIVVDSPYVLTELSGPKSIQIHLIKENEDPRVVQYIKNELPFHISKLGNPFITRQFNKDLIEKLRFAPLIAKDLQFRDEQERAYVARNMNLECGMVVFGKSGIYSICRKPFILTISSYGEETISVLENFINEDSKNNYERLEKEYAQLLYVLLLTLHTESLDRKLVKIWLRYADVVDIRILMFLLGYEVYGDLWIQNGLVDLTKKLHSLKLVHKCTDIHKLITSLKLQLKKNYKDGLKDSVNVFLSLDLILLKSNIKDGNVCVDDYEPTSYQEIAKELSKYEKEYSETLISIYERTNDIPSLLDLLRMVDIERLMHYLDSNFAELPNTYSQEIAADDIRLALTECDESIVVKVLQLMKKLNMDEKKLISSLEDSKTKVILLERLGADSPQDLTFLYEYYKAKFTTLSAKLIETLGMPLTEYVTNMTYSKPSFKEYLQIKLGDKTDYKACLDFGKKLLKVEHDINPKEGSILDDIDATYILRVMIMDFDALLENLGCEKMLDIYLSWNDFITVERLLQLDKQMFLRVYDHYLSFNCPKIVIQFLTRNIYRMNDSEQVVTVLEKIPSDIHISVLYDVLFPLFRKKNELSHNLRIKKGVFRNSNKCMNDIQSRLEQ